MPSGHDRPAAALLAAGRRRHRSVHAILWFRNDLTDRRSARPNRRHAGPTRELASLGSEHGARFGLMLRPGAERRRQKIATVGML
jgi:hypothetical protein